MTCPDLRSLSQLVDGELATKAAAAAGAHVAACATCRGQLERLDHAAAGLRAALAAHQPPAAPPVPAADCLASERVAAWVGRALDAADARAAESHLGRCDACLGEAFAAVRMLARLDAGPTAAVPPALQARVASRWAATPAGASLTAIVIRVARAGVELLERHVVAPILDVEALLVPAPAVRSAGARDAVCFRIRAPEAQIRATIVPEGSSVGLALTLLGAADDPLAGQRVFLRRHGRSLYSARTDADGALRLPRIEPGVYEVSCPGIGTSFRLDLRP